MRVDGQWELASALACQPRLILDEGNVYNLTSYTL